MITAVNLSALRALILTGIFCLGGLLPSETPAQTNEATTERNRQIITKAFEKWSAGGRTFFEDVLAPNVTWIIKGTSPAAGAYHGRQDFLVRAVKPFATRLAAPLHPTVRDIWAEGNDVVVHWDGAGTAADGKPYRNSYVWIFRMDDQRAVEVIAFLDLVPYDDVIRRMPDSQRAD